MTIVSLHEGPRQAIGITPRDRTAQLRRHPNQNVNTGTTNETMKAIEKDIKMDLESHAGVKKRKEMPAECLSQARLRPSHIQIL